MWFPKRAKHCGISFLNYISRISELEIICHWVMLIIIYRKHIIDEIKRNAIYRSLNYLLIFVVFQYTFLIFGKLSVKNVSTCNCMCSNMIQGAFDSIWAHLKWFAVWKNNWFGLWIVIKWCPLKIERTTLNRLHVNGTSASFAKCNSLNSMLNWELSQYFASKIKFFEYFNAQIIKRQEYVHSIFTLSTINQ